MPSLSTFGTTLTDLQTGMNAAQGLENQRSNFQDQVAAQRLSDFLRARSDENRTKAQRDAYMAQILESQQARGQQGRQFDAELKNRLDLGQLDATTREKVATIGAGRTDPRFADTIADIQAANNEKQNEVANLKRLSEQRKALVAERAKIKANQKWFLPNFRDPKASWYDVADFKQPDDPRWAQLNTLIAGLDVEASKLGLPVGPDEGYIVPEYIPMQVPAMLNPNLSGVGVRPRAVAAPNPVFEPSLFNPGGFALDPVNPASPVRPAPAPYVAPVTPAYNYEVDVNGNFRAVPVARPGDPRLRPVFGDIGIIP